MRGIVPNAGHDILNIIFCEDTDTHKVKNTETGEERLVRVDPGQLVGEAIANGQWECEEENEEEEEED